MSIEILEKLNISLKSHPDYKEGMQFLRVKELASGKYDFGYHMPEDQQEHLEWRAVYNEVAKNVVG